MPFSIEKDFEDALIALLPSVGWSPEVLEYHDEKQLLQNWARILFDNNRSRDRLDEYPLTEGEMQQILDQVKELRTPLNLNGFINGGSVQIVRDNPEDKEHFGKTVSLKIYNRREIAAGQSRYQIARQPRFFTHKTGHGNRRGDVMLLINGMPVIHIELKSSCTSLGQACNQIQRYSQEGCFTGIFSLIQVFVAMTPEDAVYFANPGPDGVFNPNWFFHWADFNNEPIREWDKFTRELLSIPMAHQLIGFYTVADSSDGVLKVMRSYQYQAANAISDKVAKARWEVDELGANQRGGFVWHTTGSGKTMTSFKSAQLIASSKDADKVVFLMDRIELGTQSLKEYRAFAEENEDVQETENTRILATKLKSTNPSDTLIVTSIQKMSNIGNEGEYGLKAADLEKMRARRIVFIVDECHRSTFGDMLAAIKNNFPKAMFFGFTGTPIHEENRKKKSTTATIFGDELHRYSIADGIRDRNVLGFDLYMAATYQDDDLKRAVALEKAHSKDESEVMADPQKTKIYNTYINLPMAGHMDSNGKYIRGIEDHVPNTQYLRPEHQKAVVKDILKSWKMRSLGKFHAIFATSSIPEAIDYYRLFKDAGENDFRVSTLFDPNIDNDDAQRSLDKESALLEIVEDYNALFDTSFTPGTFQAMKKDMASRLAHKRPYERIERERTRQLDLLIVVDQMLTGYDSKWVNTLYLDKVLAYENVIQAFSRTNRVFGQDKPFGIIRYYRRPHTMARNIEAAVALYSGNKPLALFVQKLPENLKEINRVFGEIQDLFSSAGVAGFDKLPEEKGERGKFAKLFSELNSLLSAALVQGFEWGRQHWEFPDQDDEADKSIDVVIDLQTYAALVERYRELRKEVEESGERVPYDIDCHVSSVTMDRIDSEYMDSRFVKFMKTMQSSVSEEERVAARDAFHATFAALSQEEQKVANILIHDMQRVDFKFEENKSFREYIAEFLKDQQNDRIHRFAERFGLDEARLRTIMELRPTAKDLNAYGRFDDLKNTFDRTRAKAYFEGLLKTRLIPPKVAAKMDNLLREFILRGGFDLEEPEGKPADAPTDALADAQDGSSAREPRGNAAP